MRHFGFIRWSLLMEGTNFHFMPGEDASVQGNATRIVESLLLNISKQERTLADLKRFRTLIDRTNDAIEVIDPQTLRFLDVNERACLDLGYSREELLSLRVCDIAPNVSSRDTGLRKRLEKSRGMVVEDIHQRKDGSRFPVEVGVGYIRLDREYHVAVVRNITERKRAEMALRDEIAERKRTEEALRRTQAYLDEAQRLTHQGS